MINNYHLPSLMFGVVRSSNPEPILPSLMSGVDKSSNPELNEFVEEKKEIRANPNTMNLKNFSF
jgi:hypothetical protein